MTKQHIETAKEFYSIDSWSAGYFSISDLGDVTCHPNGSSAEEIRLADCIDLAKKRGLDLPLILRFPQIITSQIRRLGNAFDEAVWEFSYKGRHRAVFPFKVNQRREFIDNIVRCGRDLEYGLEVGSKTEFIAALSYQMSDNALLICNGFKDSEFIEIGFVAASMGKNIELVIEGPDELKKIIDRAKLGGPVPKIGVRVKLYSRGSGKWAKSSGESSKFGLTTHELLECVKLVKAANLSDSFNMLHFHIGSQITEIKRVKNAIKEAARVFSKIRKMGMNLELIDIGGGIGVDYDGSKTSFSSSANYSLQEFANDVVYHIGEVCLDEGIPHPDIVTESGRVIAAYHSVVVTDVREIQGNATQSPQDHLADLGIEQDLEKDSKRHKNLSELKYILSHINPKNYVEFYHDAIEYYDEIFTLFNLGYIDLEERAIAEQMFYQICQSSLRFSESEAHQLEEFEELKQRMVSKYLANFSIFQSIPDSWAIGQLFPVMPLTHHNLKPTHRGSIVDITCDSDGCLEKFIDRRDIKNVLDLHNPKDEPYFLGFFLVGAYQESLANEHNLLGAINEAEIIVSEDGSWEINKLTKGDPVSELLACRNYDIDEMINQFQVQLEDKHNGLESLNFLKKVLGSLPYLNQESFD